MTNEGTGSGVWNYNAAATGLRTRLGTAAAIYDFFGAAVGLSPMSGTAVAFHNWNVWRAKGDNGEFLPDDRWRVIVQESQGSREITSYDVIVKNLQMQRALSAGCDIQFDVDFHDTSVAGIYFKPWEQYIHLEKVILGKRQVWCTGIVQPSDVDPTTGVLHLKAKGFASYPKGLPWLEDLNWLTNDAYRPIVEIWRHLQEDFLQGDLQVEVFPTTSGVEMLPGYAFDGNSMNLNFFATFIRATDKLDCGDYIDALARDIPIDYAERQQWNVDRTDVIKKIELGYPRLGLIQETLAFVINENVLSAKPHVETQTDWVSDVGVVGWFPGVEYSAQLANADPNRLRRYLKEVDALIDSNERAQAWAHRRLARRQTPPYWEQITVDMGHPNAPFGTYDVGDTITVSGFMPWVGDIRQDHKIIAISIDVTKSQCTLTLKADGAFNYDPIFFPAGVANIIANTTFDNNLAGWTPSGLGWAHDADQGHKALGSVTITADGSDHDLLTQPFGLEDFQIFPLSVYVKAKDAVSTGDVAIMLVAQFYDDDENPTQAFEIAAATNVTGLVPWQQLTGHVLTPVGSTHVAMRLHVDSTMTAGQVWFDDAELTI